MRDNWLASHLGPLLGKSGCEQPQHSITRQRGGALWPADEGRARWQSRGSLDRGAPDFELFPNFKIGKFVIQITSREMVSAYARHCEGRSADHLKPRNDQEKLGRSTKEDVMAVIGHTTTPAAQRPEQGQAGGAPSSTWQRLSGWLSSLEGPRKLTINGLLVIVSLLGAGVVLKDALKQVAVIDPISVPKDLEAAGYTPAAMGQRIIDAVTRINHDAAVVKRIGIYSLSEVDPLEPESADYQSPGRGHSWDSASDFTLMSDSPSKRYDVSVGGVSLTTVILHLRELFGRSDIRVSGEITVEPPKKFSIRLRIDDKGRVQYEAEATDTLETLVDQAALKLVERFEPLDAAYYSYHKRDYDNALRIVRAYLADQTKNERQWALNLLGLIEHARNRSDDALAEKGYNEAITVFEKLRASDPNFAPALYNHSYVLIDKGHKHLEDPDRKVARELFSRAYEIAREGIDIDEAAGTIARERAAGYATAGRALRFLGEWEPTKYKEALGYFDRSIDADPMFLFAYLMQGAIHNKCEEHDDAIAKYQRATEMNPSAQTFTRAGAYLRKYGRHADSIAMFRKAADLKPSGPAYSYWGQALRASGRPEEARERFQQAIQTDPNSPNGYNQLGLLYLEEKNWDEAATNFRLAINASPRWSNYYYNLGRALSGAGNPKDAKDAFKRAIDIYQSHPKSQAELDELELREKEGEGLPKVEQM
jgi:tetratricopeptide (TPR) repeat protein